MRNLKIGQVARRAGVTPDTVRYYESRGLIPIAPRGSGGFRRYGSETVDRILFIKEAQALGFTLGDIEELVQLKEAPNARCADVRARASTKLREIEQKIDQLMEMRSALSTLVQACGSETAPLCDCPIIDAMEHHDEG